MAIFLIKHNLGNNIIRIFNIIQFIVVVYVTKLQSII